VQFPFELNVKLTLATNLYHMQAEWDTVLFATGMDMHTHM